MNVKRTWEKVVLKNYAIGGVSLALISALLIFLFKGNLPPQVPLFYGLPVGEAQLTGYWGFLIAPGASLLITIVNIFISTLIADTFYKRVLIVSSFFVSILVAITVLKIIFLVGIF